MFTVIFALIFAIIGIIGMAFFAMSGSIISIMLVVAIAIGLIIDQMRADRRQHSR